MPVRESVYAFVVFMLELVERALFHARPEGWAVIVLILAVAAVAVQNLVRNSRRLTSEAQLLENHRYRTGKMTRSELVEYLKTLQKDTTVGTALHAVYGFRDAQSIDMEAIATLLNQKEASHLSFPRLAPNLLLLFGLFGTVLGLAGAVGTLSPQISESIRTTNPETLTSALSVTLSHMQTAFACTLWGILCATGISLSTRKIAAKQNEIIAEIQQFVIHEVAPKVILANERVQIEELRKVVSESRSVLAQIAGQMQQVSEQFKAEMQVISQSLSENVDIFRRTLDTSLNHAEQTVTTLAQTSQSIAESLGSVVENIQGTVKEARTTADSINQSTRSLGEYHQKLTEVQERITQTYQDTQRQLEEQISSQLSKLRELQQALDRTSADMVGRIDRATDRMEAVSRAVAENTEKASRNFLTIQGVVRHHYEEIEGAVERLFKEHSQKLQGVDQSILLVADRLRDLKHSLSPQELPTEEWARLNNTLNALIQVLRQSRGEPSAPSLTIPTVSGDGVRQAIEENTTAIRLLNSSLERNIQLSQQLLQAMQMQREQTGKNTPPTALIENNPRAPGEVLPESVKDVRVTKPMGKGETADSPHNGQESSQPQSSKIKALFYRLRHVLLRGR